MLFLPPNFHTADEYIRYHETGYAGDSITKAIFMEARSGQIFSCGLESEL
jgi:hypothetical protein